MAYAERHSVTITTDGSGDAIGYTPVITGKILKVIYDKTDYADGVDLDIVTETTAQNIWVEANVNADKAVCPRQATHDTVGAASLYAAGGEPVEDYIWAVNERVKITVDEGGATKSGVFIVLVGG